MSYGATVYGDSQTAAAID